MSSCFTSGSDDIFKSNDLCAAKVQIYFELCKRKLILLHPNFFGIDDLG